MKIQQIIILITVVIIYQIIATLIRKIKRKKEIILNYEESVRLRIRRLFNMLDEGKEITEKEVYPYAADRLTRLQTFIVLKEFNKEYLFPHEFYSLEACAESRLATWLEHPKRLGTYPDDMNLLEKVTIEREGNEPVFYFVFEFLVNKAHWSSHKRWMLGVAGPYDSKIHFYEKAGAYSRYTVKSEETSIREEAEWAHSHIFRKKIMGMDNRWELNSEDLLQTEFSLLRSI